MVRVETTLMRIPRTPPIVLTANYCPFTSIQIRVPSSNFPTTKMAGTAVPSSVRRLLNRAPFHPTIGALRKRCQQLDFRRKQPLLTATHHCLIPRLVSSSAKVSVSQLNSPVCCTRYEDEMLVLGIETSCDDTAAAVVRSNGEILSQV